MEFRKSKSLEQYLVPEAAVVHGSQPVVDGGSSVLAQGLSLRHCINITVLQGLHHGFTDFLLYLQHK